MFNNLTKIISVAVLIVAVTLLAIVPVPAVAMNMTGGDCDSPAMSAGFSIPPCCLMTGCPLPGGDSSNTTSNGVLLPNRLTPNDNVCYSLSTTSLSTRTGCNSTINLEGESPQGISSSLHSECRCRNSLSSEDPYLS